MPISRIHHAWLMLCAATLASAAHAEPLSFADAVARAAVEGPTIEAERAAVEAARRSVLPADQLPDPQLLLGVANLPIDGPDAYRLDRDFMTMQSVGLMQDMPSGAERRARRAVARADAARAESGLEITQLAARLAAAQAWLELHYAQKRNGVLVRIAHEQRALAEAARARLSGGAGNADDAVAAAIESARAEDRLAEATAATAAARSGLRRWLGDGADQELGADAPVFMIDPERLREHLRHHPELTAYQGETALAQANLRMARAETMPDWSWSVMYQRRAPEFSDMASVEVRIGLPLFQAWRQGPLIEARRFDATRVVALAAAAEREHAAMLESQLADYQATAANLARARETRLPLARQRAEAITGGFAAGTATSTQMLAARRDALEAELDVLDLEQRLTLLGAALSFQYGAPTP